MKKIAPELAMKNDSVTSETNEPHCLHYSFNLTL